MSDHLNDDTNHSDLKQQYVHLLNEREQLIQIQESMSKELRVTKEDKKEAQELGEALKERLRHLERELTQSNTEKSMLEKRLKVICRSKEFCKLATKFNGFFNHMYLTACI